MIVLDTNVVSELMKEHPDPRVFDWMQRVNDETFAATVITIVEIAFGLRRLPSGRRRNAMAKRFSAMVNRLTVVPLEVHAAFRAGEFRAIRVANGMSDDPSDMMIAAIADGVGAKLATRNTKDFNGLPIDVVNPWQAN